MKMVLFFAYFHHLIRAPGHPSLGFTRCCYSILAARSLGCGRRRRPCLALHHQLVLHSRPLIYGGRIKRHGLYRSAVAFLYSHRHSWGTAGWSGKRFMASDPRGVLKTLASAAATSSSFPPSPRSPLPPPTKTRRRGQSRAAPGAQHHVWAKAPAAPSTADNVDTTDT